MGRDVRVELIPDAAVGVPVHRAGLGVATWAAVLVGEPDAALVVGMELGSVRRREVARQAAAPWLETL